MGAADQLQEDPPVGIPGSEGVQVFKLKLLTLVLMLKNAFFFQAGVGVSANTFLLFFLIFRIFTDCWLKPTDLITCHLAFIHLVMLLCAVHFLSSDLFESLNFQNDFKCKALFYLTRVMRGLSICNTCLLSMLQAITISPSTSWLARFKHKFANYIVHVLFFYWSLNLSSSSILILHTVALSNMTQTNLLKVGKYCSLSPMNSIIRGLVFILSLSQSVFFVGMMLLSSTYMVILLLKHQKRSQHLHSTNLSLRAFAEKRATQTILLLVSCFVFMYLVDIMISSSLTMLWAYNPIILDIQNIVANLYATVCPLIQISSDKRIIYFLKKYTTKIPSMLIRV
ncbi:putative vomeronasal receptor-like protein 4 [Otolemur garnettii]|uniref:putative vomeronasal receptor-like protein 4 n=1 Tax=Otolemur garnettii TaxID=30611 RepID=UPI000C7EF307|nr:putative vomeronasal receptor-like protein 4 [Otolemur garnettii]